MYVLRIAYYVLLCCIRSRGHSHRQRIDSRLLIPAIGVEKDDFSIANNE